MSEEPKIVQGEVVQAPNETEWFIVLVDYSTNGTGWMAHTAYTTIKEAMEYVRNYSEGKRTVFVRATLPLGEVKP